MLLIPTINDGRWDNNTLADLWRQVAEAGFTEEYFFDFRDCRFLRQNAVAFLGGLVRLIQHRGGHVCLCVDTMRDALRANLLQNGFAHAMGAEIGSWRGNSVPFREDRMADKDAIVDGYLSAQWLGRGWMHISAGLRNAIIGQMWEIYQNAFEHGRSPVGVFSCGQYYRRLRELRLTVVDFGVGIPSNARTVNVAYTPQQAMQWAFVRGTTSARSDGIGRGLGLDFLKGFVRSNQGTLEVFSHDGYARIDGISETYNNSPAWFEGTLVNVGLRCDERYYCLSNELSGATDKYF